MTIENHPGATRLEPGHLLIALGACLLGSVQAQVNRGQAYPPQRVGGGASGLQSARSSE